MVRPIWAALAACLLALLVSPRAAAQEVRFGRVDGACVRLLAYAGVDFVRVQKPSGEVLRVAVPMIGHGTGLVTTADGMVLTAKHVVEGAMVLAALTPGSSVPVPVRSVYEDRETDVALVALPGEFPAFISLPERAPAVEVRSEVFVVGYPLDATRVTAQSQQGIISGVLPNGDLQLGIALNPGNSGGPVIDRADTVLGVAVARMDPTQGAQGIGLAVPVSRILPVWKTALAAGAHAAAREKLAAAGERDAALARLLGAVVLAADPFRLVRLGGTKVGKDAGREALRDAMEAALSAAPDSAPLHALVAAYHWNAAAAAGRDDPRRGPLRRAAREHARKARELAPDGVGASTFIRVAAGDTGQAAPAETEEAPSGEPSPDEEPSEEDDTPAPLEAPGLRGSLLAGLVYPIDGSAGAQLEVADGSLNLRLRALFGVSGKHVMFEGRPGFVLASWGGASYLPVLHRPEESLYQRAPSRHRMIVEGSLGVHTVMMDVGADEERRAAATVGAGLRYSYFQEIEWHRETTTRLCSVAATLTSGAIGERDASFPGWELGFEWGSPWQVHVDFGGVGLDFNESGYFFFGGGYDLH